MTSPEAAFWGEPAVAAVPHANAHSKLQATEYAEWLLYAADASLLLQRTRQRIALERAGGGLIDHATSPGGNRKHMKAVGWVTSCKAGANQLPIQEPPTPSQAMLGQCVNQKH